MFPVLFNVPILNINLYSYGALIFVGFLLALFAVYRQALLEKKYHNDVVDFGAWALIGGLLGCKILYIIVEYKEYFITNPFKYIPSLGIYIPNALLFWEAGGVFWGGPVGGLLAAFIFCKKRGINMAAFIDLYTLGLPIGLAFGRIGCVAAGCCYGYPSYHLGQAEQVIADTPFALSFPKYSSAFEPLKDGASAQTLSLMQTLGTTVPLFPVQLLESVGSVFIFFLLLLVTRFKRAHGQVILAYLLLYSIIRSFNETYRGDLDRGFVMGDWLSTSQFISIIMSSIALLGFLYLYQQSKKLNFNYK